MVVYPTPKSYSLTFGKGRVVPLWISLKGEVFREQMLFSLLKCVCCLWFGVRNMIFSMWPTLLVAGASCVVEQGLLACMHFARTNYLTTLELIIKITCLHSVWRILSLHISMRHWPRFVFRYFSEANLRVGPKLINQIGYAFPLHFRKGCAEMGHSL